jgi:hypothetical protein
MNAMQASSSLSLARKLVERLVQFKLIEDHGERNAFGAVIWHPTKDGVHLQDGARLLAHSGIIGTRQPRDDQLGEFIAGGLLELDPDYRWRMTELATVLLKLPCVLAPPITLH